MAQNIHFYLLITIMIYLSQTFAQWIGQTLYVPGPETTNNCENWIVFSGFDRTSPSTNIERAKSRNKVHDKDVSIWAVINAHYFTAFPERLRHIWYLPKDYCFSHKMGNEVLLPFQNYSNFRATCNEWLQFYNYSNYDPQSNFIYADERVRTEDGVISLWVAVYGQLITKYKRKDSISITKFCNIMVENDNEMLFMSLDGTRKDCAEWIYMSGYTNDPSINLKKAINERYQIEKYQNFINYWTVWYAGYLLRSDTERTSFLGLYASSSQNTGDIDDYLMTPLQFCIHEKYLEDNPVTYYNTNNNRPRNN